MVDGAADMSDRLGSRSETVKIRHEFGMLERGR